MVLVLLAAAAVAWAVILIVTVLAGVFSVHGFLYSFGLASSDGLALAPAVRVVTLVGLFQIGVVASMVADYLDGRRFLEARWAYLAAHISVFIHTARVVAWACRGIAFVCIRAVAVAAWAWRGVAPVMTDFARLLADRRRERAQREPRPAATRQPPFWRPAPAYPSARRALMAAPPVLQKPQPAVHEVTLDGTFMPGRIINLYQEWPDEAAGDIAS